MEVAEQTLTELITGPYDYHRPRRGDIRRGVLLSLENGQAVVDIGAKREGIVPRRDLELLSEEAVAQLAVGDEVRVYIMSPEDRDGNLLVSINLAQREADWKRAEQLLENGGVWEGEVKGYNRGGLLVAFGRLQGFVPMSHVVQLRRGLNQEEKKERLAGFVGEKLPLKVIEVTPRRRRLVLSNRAAVRAWRRKQRERLLEELTEGDVVHGTVSSLCDFGAFVDLGGGDGLVHISELAWHRVRHPSEVLQEGQEVDVYVLRLDRERKRIGLSIKQLRPDPWSLVDVKYAPTDLVEGVVTNVVDFGAFVRVEAGVEGLVHVSEMPDGPDPGDVLSPGQRVLVRVLRVEPERRRIGLSLRQVDTWEREEWLAQQEERVEGQSSEQTDQPATQGQEDSGGEISEKGEEVLGVDLTMPEHELEQERIL